MACVASPFCQALLVEGDVFIVGKGCEGVGEGWPDVPVFIPAFLSVLSLQEEEVPDRDCRAWLVVFDGFQLGLGDLDGVAFPQAGSLDVQGLLDIAFVVPVDGTVEGFLFAVLVQEHMSDFPLRFLVFVSLSSFPERLGVDLDGDGQEDINVSVVAARPGAAWTDENRMLRDGMRRSLEFAQMSKFRVNMSHAEYVSALGITTRLELGLISWFREAIPDPKESWDESRRWREVERRIARLRWVADEEQKEYGGIKGILNRIMGKRKPTGKEMFEKMVSEADWMVEAMRAGRTDRDVISEVQGYLGLEEGPPSLPAA